MARAAYRNLGTLLLPRCCRTVAPSTASSLPFTTSPMPAQPHGAHHQQQDHATPSIAAAAATAAAAPPGTASDTPTAPPPPRFSVLVVGSGAVGTLYGARLAEAGHSVTFLLRSQYQVCKTRGLTIVSDMHGNMHIPGESPCLTNTAEGLEPVDWLLVGLKAYALRHARELAGPAYGPNTMVLAITNGLVDDELEQAFGTRDKLYGAIAYVAADRPEPGVVRHLLNNHLLIGHLKDDAAALPAVEELWAGSRMKVTAVPCLLAARWEKLLWNTPFSGMSLALGGATTDKISADPELHAEATRVMEETFAIGNADLAAQGSAEQLAPALLDHMWYLTHKGGAYLPSASADLLAGRPVELEHFMEVPLARAAALGVPAPALARQTALARAAVEARGAQQMSCSDVLSS